MKALAVFRVSLRQGRRDLITIVLSLVFAPVFVVLYAMAYSGETTYMVGVLNADRSVTVPGAGAPLDAGSTIVEALGQQPADRAGSGPGVRLAVRRVTDRQAGLALLRERHISLLLEIPPDLSQRLASRQDVTLTVEGNPTDQKYMVAGVMVAKIAESYVNAMTGRAAPLALNERLVSGTEALTDFDLSVAGLLVFAVIMLVFLVSMTVARDVESGVMRRLRLTGMRSTDYLAGTSGLLLLVALAGVLLTFATAVACDFHSNGGLWAAVLVTAVAALAVIGVGLVVGALSRTVARAFVIANFPLGAMMFLSGAIFPIPQPVVATLAGHPVGPFDLIPGSAAVSALNKILVLGQGLPQVAFELTQLLTLSLLYFLLGAVVLHRRHLRTGSA